MIIVVLLVALVIGYQKGIIQPLMTYLFFFGALFLIYRDRGQYLAGVEKYLHANTVLAIAFALIIAVVAGYAGSVVGTALHRMPIARGIDGFLGIFINVGIAIAVVYFVLTGLITFYQDFVRPQLRGSRIAPYIMRIGQKIPLLGHDGPNDLPR